MTVFVFDFKNQIVQKTYADHVLESIVECTHHTGVMPTLKVEELVKENGELSYAVVSRNSRDLGFSIDQEFETEDEAKDYWFCRLENTFLADDSRDISYYSNYQDAIIYRALDVLKCKYPRLCDEVLISIAKKEQLLLQKGRI